MFFTVVCSKHLYKAVSQMDVISLDKLQPGEKGTIDRILTGNHVRQRLLEMGLTNGTLIDVLRLAPFGDPIAIGVRGYRLSLRREEASAILVRQLATAV